jgi:hypothetical protein
LTLVAAGSTASLLAQRPRVRDATAPAHLDQSTLELDTLYEQVDPRALQDAAERGLAWLAAQQESHGGWPADVGHKQQDDYYILSSTAEQKARGQAHLGVTAICGLAFLAGGHLPGRGKYGNAVDATLRYMLAHTAENGYLRDGETRMYSHAFATLFLAQAYGMVRAPAIKSSLERAVHWIVDNQNRYGAWRYNPFTAEADLSVTVCQLQALRAARNIGIEVPKDCIDRALAYVLESRVSTGYHRGLFHYKIRGRGAYSKPAEFSINAAAVTALASAGNYDQVLWAPALDLVDEKYPETRRFYADHYYYWYGNYYACQAFFWAGGARFHAYYRRLADDLLELQRDDGRWLNHVGPGDVFATAVAALILQVPRQYLPIFQR